MVELKIEVSEDLKQKMLELHGVDWSRVIDAFVREKISEWARLRLILNKSKLTEKDSLELGRKVNESLANKYKESLSFK